MVSLRNFRPFACVLILIAPLIPRSANADVNTLSESELVSAMSGLSPSDQRIAARRLGEMHSLTGLEAILKGGQAGLLFHYGNLGQFRGTPQFSAMQRLVARYVSDPVLRPKLIYRLKGVVITELALYDALYALRHAMRSANDLQTLMSLLGNAVIPDIDQRSISLLADVGDPAANAVFRGMARRKSHIILPYMKKYLETHPARSHLVVWNNLWLFDTPESRQFIIDSMIALGKLPPDENTLESTRTILELLSTHAKTKQPDPARIVAAIPHKENNEIASVYIQYVKHLYPAEAAKDMHRYLISKPELSDDAFNILLRIVDLEKYDSIEKSLAKAHKKGTIDQATYIKRSSYVNESVTRYRQQLQADPDRRIREKKSAELDSRRAKLIQKYFRENASMRIIDSESTAAYLKEVSRILKDYPANGSGREELEMQVVSGYIFLGNYYRFNKKSPKKAIKTYQHLYSFARKAGVKHDVFALLLIADTYQYDLSDRGAAAKWYNKAGKAMPGSSICQTPALCSWSQALIEHLAHYLDTGNVLPITLSEEQLTGAGDALALSLALLWSESLSPKHLRNKAKPDETLPYSQFSFHAEATRQIEETPDQYLSRLARLDPTGFWQASYFSLLKLRRQRTRDAGANNPGVIGRDVIVLRAADQFLAKRKIELLRRDRTLYASPEITFATYKQALKEKNMELAMSCITPHYRNKVEKSFRSIPAERWLQLGNDLRLGEPNIVMQGLSSYTVILQGSSVAGEVFFKQVDGLWLIDDM